MSVDFLVLVSLVYCRAKSTGSHIRDAVTGKKILKPAILVDVQVGICTLKPVDILGPGA